MNREALKFIDLDSFFAVAEGMGYNGEIKDLIYEQDKLPYCTAYFVPLHLLPTTFDLDTIEQFGGTITQVYDVRYLGNEDFETDFMIFPLSLVGYVEVESFSPTTFVHEQPLNDWATGEMIYVINLEDGGGKEFYYAQSGNLIALADQSQEEPQQYKTYKQFNKQLDILRERHAKTCRIYALDMREFEARRKILQAPK